MINKKLKNIIKEPRPSKPVKFLDTDKFNKKKYGNPSGHTQLLFFSFMYAYLVIGKLTKLFMFSIFICIITIYQRYTFRNHTPKQLLYGAIVGLIMAYVSYSITTYIKNFI
jgi:membrane-associated phospholipid phosphatase